MYDYLLWILKRAYLRLGIIAFSILELMAMVIVFAMIFRRPR